MKGISYFLRWQYPPKREDLNPIQDSIKMVHRAFCSVTCLEITISGFKYIFREMLKLKYLGISVRKSKNRVDVTCASVDRLLIAEAEWIAKGLKLTPDYWEYFKAKTGYDYNPSITNLTCMLEKYN